jgi:hypothetical protein
MNSLHYRNIVEVPRNIYSLYDLEDCCNHDNYYDYYDNYDCYYDYYVCTEDIFIISKDGIFFTNEFDTYFEVLIDSEFSIEDVFQDNYYINKEVVKFYKEEYPEYFI